MTRALPREETLPGVTASWPASEEAGAERSPCRRPCVDMPTTGLLMEHPRVLTEDASPHPLLPSLSGTLPVEKGPQHLGFRGCDF